MFCDTTLYIMPISEFYSLASCLLLLASIMAVFMLRGDILLQQINLIYRANQFDLLFKSI